MKLIDIDNISLANDHIHYITAYEGSAVLMSSESRIFRFSIGFTVEHKPMGEPDIKVKFNEHPHFPVLSLIKKVKLKIRELDKKGTLAALHKKK